MRLRLGEDAGVQHQHVEPAEARAPPALERCVDRLGVGDVAGDAQEVGALRTASRSPD